GPLGEDGRGVGADGEEGGVTEGDLTRVAGQEVEAERHQHVDEEPGHHVEDVIVHDAREQQQACAQRDEEGDPEALQPRAGHRGYTFRTGAAPNRPLGRTTRTRISRMYVETCLMPALKK